MMSSSIPCPFHVQRISTTAATQLGELLLRSWHWLCTWRPPWSPWTDLERRRHMTAHDHRIIGCLQDTAMECNGSGGTLWSWFWLVRLESPSQGTEWILKMLNTILGNAEVFIVLTNCSISVLEKVHSFLAGFASCFHRSAEKIADVEAMATTLSKKWSSAGGPKDVKGQECPAK